MTCLDHKVHVLYVEVDIILLLLQLLLLLLSPPLKDSIECQLFVLYDIIVKHCDDVL